MCPSGKVKKELEPEDGPLPLDETAKLLQELQEAQAERGGSRPSSNVSSLSNASEREHHTLGTPSAAVAGSPAGLCGTASDALPHVAGSPSHLSVGEQPEVPHDPYEFLQSPEPAAPTKS